MYINITEECGKNTVSRHDAVEVFKKINCELSQNETVEIDFNNILIASVSFIDEVFGQLAQAHSLECMKQKLKLKNIQDYDRALVNDIIKSRSREKRIKDGEAA